MVETDRERTFIIKEDGKEIDDGRNSAVTIRKFVNRLKELGYLERLAKISETRLIKEMIIKTNDKKMINKLDLRVM